MFRKFVVALSLVGLLGLGGLVDLGSSAGGYTPACFDCWEMRAR